MPAKLNNAQGVTDVIDYLFRKAEKVLFRGAHPV
jgi:hypothetical protein